MCPCALPLASAPASVSQALACLPVLAHPLRLLCEMSARQDEQCAHLTISIASMQASLNNKAPTSSPSLPALPSGCRSCKRGPLRLTRLLPTFAKTLPPKCPHQCPLSRPQVQVLSGPCPSLEGQQSLCLTGGRPRPSLPARYGRSWGKTQDHLLPAQPAPEAWHQLDDECQRSAVLVCFPFGQNKDAVRKFSDESFPSAGLAFDIMCKKVSVNARLLFPSKGGFPAIH